MPHSTRLSLLLTMISLLPTAENAAAEKIVEITLNGQQRTGHVFSHDRTHAWFLERDGRLENIPLAEVTDYKVLGTYRPWNAVELRDRLTRELGRSFSVTTTGHYVVATAHGVGNNYAPLFEDLYRQFVVTFAARGFKITNPEFPLVAIVFPDEAGFYNYCQSEGIQPQPGLRGYYLPTSNRVALYDTAAAGQTSRAGLDATIIHEAVHQVAFNTGLHSRTGTNPKWVVEGLATAFEVANLRENNRTLPVQSRANTSRLKWLQASPSARPSLQLTDLISQDTRFAQATLDAYSDAWALTFYLLENRSADYTAYLKRLAQRDPRAEYSPEARLADFQLCFGRDVSLLESRVQRMLNDLAAP